MDQACQTFRIEWLSGARAEHASLCPACAHWTRSTERQRQALTSLGRPTAPTELDERVARELAGDRSLRLERALGSLPRRAAPAVLDEHVAGFFERVAGDETRGERKAEALRSLDVHPAPAVLERLLNEELAAPERARTERFPGSLERLEAPEELRQKIELRVRRRALVRLVLGPLATLAAAGLVVWIAVRGGEREPNRYRFEVIQATSLEGLDPMARALAESLGGSAGDGR